jgi:hypothetical protein
MHCTLSGNSAGANGGAIDNHRQLALTHCTVSGNTSRSLGGGIHNSFDVTVTLTNTLVAGNTAEANPAGADILNHGTLTRVGANIVPFLENYGNGTVGGTGTISTTAPLLASLAAARQRSH